MRSRSTSALEPALAFAAFASLAVLFFWQLWALNPADRRMIGPADGDLARQFYPYRAFVANEWASGRLPVWNPHQYAGTPTLADPQQAVLYPWRLLQAPLAMGAGQLPLWSVQLEAVAHVVLAGWFTFLLLRRLGAPAAPAFLGGSAFAFGGYVTGYPLEQLAVLDTAAWVPAVLLCLTAALDGDGRRWVRWSCLAAIATALMVLAGHPQTAAYGAGLALAWLFARARGQRVPGLRLLATTGIWLVGATCLSAPQWLPSAALLPRLAERFRPEDVLAGFPPTDVVQLIVPHVVSRWSPLYVGVVSLTLAAWGLFAVRRTRFWAGAAFLAWVLALGGHGPLFPLVLRLAPVAGLFRHQERLAVVCSLGLSVAAGLAAAALVQRPPRAARIPAVMCGGLALSAVVIAAVGAVRPSALVWASTVVGIGLSPDGGTAALADALVFAALVAALGAAALALRASDRLGAERLGWALLALTLVDVFSVNRGHALGPSVDVYEADAIVQALVPHARDGRVSSEAHLPGGGSAASVFGLYDTTGDSPIHLVSTSRLVEQAPEMAWWRLLAVRYLVSARTWQWEAPVSELARSEAATLYEVMLPAPPAWVTGAWRTVEDDWVPAADFDPLVDGVVVDGGLARGAAAPGARERSEPPAAGAREPPSGGAADEVSPASSGDARLVSLDGGRATVQARLEEPGLVVLSTAYDPGWRASARSDDGRKVAPPVLRAYGALPSVALAAGTWTVEWTYWPRELSFALMLGALGVALVASSWLWSARAR